MIKLQPTDILKFGKNAGLTLAEIYQFQPSYIEWAILNLDGFRIDMEKFENLPAPTTIGYNGKQFEERKMSPSTKFIEEINGKTIINIEYIEYLIEVSDSFNPFSSVAQIKEMIFKEGHPYELWKDLDFLTKYEKLTI